MKRRQVEILLVEDSPSDRLIIGEAFEKSRMDTQLHTVPDGVEAMRYIRGEHPYTNLPRPDLILLDLNLPRMTGHEVLAQLKDDPEYQTIPVIVLSSSGDEQDVSEAYRHHANCYITKPVEFKGFLKTVRSIEQLWFRIGQVPFRDK